MHDTSTRRECLGIAVTSIVQRSAGDWYLRQTPRPGRPELAYSYGTPDFEPVTGDWDGDGVDGTGVLVQGAWYLRAVASPGQPPIGFSYGARGYRPVVGDFDGDGHDGKRVCRSVCHTHAGLVPSTEGDNRESGGQIEPLQQSTLAGRNERKQAAESIAVAIEVARGLVAFEQHLRSGRRERNE